MTAWKHDDYDPPPEDDNTYWENEGGYVPPEECEDWDLAPVREKLTRLACGE